MSCTCYKLCLQVQVKQIRGMCRIEEWDGRVDELRVGENSLVSSTRLQETTRNSTIFTRSGRLYHPIHSCRRLSDL